MVPSKIIPAIISSHAFDVIVVLYTYQNKHLAFVPYSRTSQQWRNSQKQMW